MEPPHGLVHGKFTYKVKRDPNTSLRKASLSVNKYNLTIPCTVFKSDCNCYATQCNFNAIKDSNTLRMISLDEGNGCFLTEDLYCTFEEWLQKMLVEDIQGDKGAAWRHYSKDDSHTPWWNKIRQEFKDIFGPIICGLAAIHRANWFHGGILKGVAIKSNPDNTRVGVLYNMTSDPKQRTPRNIKCLQGQDIRDLRSLMQKALWYPFDLYKVDRPGHITEECYSLCLLQLNKRVSIGNTWAWSLMGMWGLRLAIFWEEIEKIAFMKRVYRVIYDELPKYPQCKRDFAYKHFKNYYWEREVMTHGTDQLKAVLLFKEHKSFNKPSDKPEEGMVPSTFREGTAKNGLDKLRFWRICMEHMDLGNASNIQNHLEIMKILPELFLEVVEFFHYLLHTNSFKPSMVSLFRDMGWYKLKRRDEQKKKE